MAALHILDSQTPPECLHNLAQLVAPGEQLVCLGPLAMPPGVSMQVQTLHRPMGSSLLAGLANSHLADQATAVHAWSVLAGNTAELLARRRGCPLVVSPGPELDRQQLRQLSGLAAAGTTVITVHTEAHRRRLVADGIASPAVQVVPPAAAALAQQPAMRQRVRAALGLADGRCLLVAPSDMTRQAGHKYACWVMGILRQVRDDISLVIPSDGPARASVQYFASTLGYERDMFFTAGRLGIGEALAAADLALFLHKGNCCLWSLVAAMAAGLPIVAWETEDIAECSEGGQAAGLCRAGDVRPAAAGVLRLLEHQAAARALGARAAALAGRRFSPTQVRRRLDEIYSAGRRAASP